MMDAPRTAGTEVDIARLCHSISEASPIPTVAVTGVDHTIQYANRAFCLLSGRASAALIGTTLCGVPPVATECVSLLNRVYRTGNAEIDANPGHSAAHPFHWSYAAWPMVATDDSIIGILVQVTETTTFHRQAAAMNEALLVGSVRQHELMEAAVAHTAELQAENKARQNTELELRRANENLNQFALAASHDLQEPLRMIISYSELLRKSYQAVLAGDGAVYLNFVTNGAKQMRQLLMDLLSYVRIDKDEGRPFESVDLNQIFRQATEILELAIEDSSATVTSDQLPTVQGYSAHFVQLFQNLISNALKYCGERPPRVHVSFRKLDGAWEFAVADAGIGIDVKYHRQIFGVFKRLHGRAIPGTGVGLAICERVVQRYGGRIWVESAPDQGATFYFTVPVGPKVRTVT